MSKKIKLSLEEIKVQSFVTGLKEDIIKKMNGGTDEDRTTPTPRTYCGVTNNPCYTQCNGGPAC